MTTTLSRRSASVRSILRPTAGNLSPRSQTRLNRLRQCIRKLPALRSDKAGRGDMMADVVTLAAGMPSGTIDRGALKAQLARAVYPEECKALDSLKAMIGDQAADSGATLHYTPGTIDGLTCHLSAHCMLADVSGQNIPQAVAAALRAMAADLVQLAGKVERSK